MTTAKRLSYSLLVSTLAFALFAVFAFSGLFPWIEAQFYSPRVVGEFQTQLDLATKASESWQKTTLDRLGKLLGDQAFSGVFSPTASQEAIQKRFQSTKLFLLGTRGGGALRIVSPDLRQVHFSSEETDVKVKTDFRLTYRPVSEITSLPDLGAPALIDGKAHLLLDASASSLIFLSPWQDPLGAAGFALLTVSLEDLRMFLIESGVSWAQRALVPLSAEEYVFSLVGRVLDPAVVTRIRDLRSQGILPPVQRLAQADGQFTVALIHKGKMNLVVPSSSLDLNDVLKSLLLASFYTVVFLVVFLLANLRGEPVSAVTRKVKRFQLQVVKQYFDLKERDKIQSLRDELAQHSDEIRADVRRSLGRVRKRDQEWVDRYIDTSWQEVMDLLRGPSPPPEAASNADWKRLETLLQQALTQGRFVVSGVQEPATPRTSPRVVPKKPVSEVDLEEVEEAEAVEDLEEVEEAEAVEDLGDVEEAEAVEDLEEVEEAEAVEDLEDVEEAEAVEDLEEVEEAEAVEDLEDVEEAEAVEDLEEVEEAEAVEDLEDVEEAEAVEDLEEVEVLEELDDAELLELDEDEGTLEELPDRQGVDFSGLQSLRAEVDPLTLLPFSPEENADDIEELEATDEGLDESGSAPEAPGDDVSIPLERLDSIWAQQSGVFEENEDVIRLKEDLFSERSQGRDAFGQLVDEVLAGPEASTFEPLQEDLVPQHIVRDWRWTGAGFDWDRFALGIDEVNLFRGLSEIVSQFDAFTAAILTEIEGVWKAQSSVGFSDSGKDLLSYDSETPIVRSFLSLRALHVLKGGGTHPVLRASFHIKDLKFLKSVVCIPLLFHHEPAWLLLGLRRDPDDLLELLAPRRMG